MTYHTPISDSVLDAFPEAALILDTSADHIAAWNAAAARILTGMTNCAPGAFSQYVHSALPEFVVFLEEVDHRGEGWTRDIALRSTHGDVVKCELRARQIAGAEHRLLLTISDLKELERRAEVTATAETFRAGLTSWKRAQSFFSEMERENQLILDAAGEGIYGVNADGKTTFVNRAAQEMLGWDVEDLLGYDIHSKIHHHHLNGDHYHSHDCPIYQSFRFEQVNRIEDEVFWRKDGKPIRVEYVSTPIYDQTVLVGAVVIFRDITERKEGERKLREALDEVAALRDRLEQENAYLQEAITTERAHNDIIGNAPAIQQIIARIDLVAGTDATVLINGETGTGKSLVAAAIHKASPRARRPLIHFKCSSVAAKEIEAELFGQVRGAPNGATRDKPGKLELAHGGTLFLDDVEELPMALQGKLLAALQASAVTRIGDTRAKPLDIRVIASTSLSDGQVRRGAQIRSDLHLFLNVFPIACSPLRERLEDIPLLAAHLLKFACQRLNRPVPILTEHVAQQLRDYDWPGNVRELQNVMERAAIVSKDTKLVIELGGNTPNVQPGMSFRTEAQMQDIARSNFIAVLKKTEGQIAGKTGAAVLMGVKPTTLYSRMKSMRIQPDEWQG